MDRKRDRLLQVRMHDVELEMLDAIVENEGITASEWVRHVIRTAYSGLPPKMRRAHASVKRATK